VHRFVAAGGPTCAALDVRGVRLFTDEKIASRNARALDLQVAFEAKVVVAFDEELAIDRAVRPMANGAAFAQGFVFENKRPALLAMTIRASFVQARHRQAAGGLHDVVAMWLMAVHAVHVAFDDGMMLRQIKFGVDVDVALKTGRSIFPGIHDETSAPAANAHMFAGGAVAGFAAGHLRELNVVFIETAMRACWKAARNIGVTFDARRVADKVRARNAGRRIDGSIQRRTTEQDQEKANSNTATSPQKIPFHLYSICAGTSDRYFPLGFFTGNCFNG
jgi:hypothetical protein